jgi:hypothetical protein
MASPGFLSLIDDSALRDDVDRVCAAAGVSVVHASEPSSRKVWTGAVAVLLDAPAARRCSERSFPRRGRVMFVIGTEPVATDWQAAMSVGAQRVVTLPAQEGELMAELSEAAEAFGDDGHRGPVVAVIAGRGGGGASVFATALARSATEALLIDADPWGGGLDLLVGSEAVPGLRWPDLELRGGRLTYGALTQALPQHQGVRVLSGSRGGGDIEAAPLGAVIDAGSRGGATVVLVTPADVRSCAAAASVARWAGTVNPNSGVVVRGPAPGGLRPAEVAEIVGLPLLAAMRPQPGVARTLEHGGLRVGRRSPLAAAARQVLATLQQHSRPEAA